MKCHLTLHIDITLHYITSCRRSLHKFARKTDKDPGFGLGLPDDLDLDTARLRRRSMGRDVVVRRRKGKFDGMSLCVFMKIFISRNRDKYKV